MDVFSLNSGTKAANFVMDNIPLIDTIPMMHEAKKAVMASIFDDTYGEYWNNRLAWFEENRGQGFLTEPIANF
jgi:hypothetical protein